MINVSALVKVLRNGNTNEIETTINNRKMVNQRMLDFLALMQIEGVKIESYDLGLSTWYHIHHNGVEVASQFYWNDGEYDAQGNHSHFDEYGFRHAHMA